MNIWKRGVCLLLTLVMAAALAGMPAGAAGDAGPGYGHHGLRAHRGEPSV